MNLRGRIGKWALFIMAPFFLMCEDPNEIGAELNPNDDNLNVLYKEFTLPTSVVFSDSVATSGANRYLVGVFDDPVFGRIKATTYTQLGIYEGIRPPSPIEPDAIFDSAFVYLHFDYFYGNDFRETQRFTIRELTDTIFNNVVYNSSIRTGFTLINNVAAHEMTISPAIDSMQRIRLSDDYGEDIMNITILEQPASSFHPAVRRSIRGLAIVPEDDMDYIFGINTTVTGDSLNPESESALRIYYHRRNQDLAKFFDFTLRGSARHISYETDRSGTVLNNLTAPFEEFIPPDGKRYVQPATGIYTKIDMSPVRNFIDSLDGFLVNKAEFFIGPATSQSGDFLHRLENFNLAFTDNTNKVRGYGLQREPLNSVVLDDAGYINSTGNLSPFNFTLDDDSDMIFENQVSNFIQIMADRIIEQPDLMIYPRQSDYSSLNHLIFDADAVKLRLFYTTLQ